MPLDVAAAPGRTRRRKSRLTRAQKSEQTRRALFDAAARVVGWYGYAGASISRITGEANVAQGTFYIYFDSRQDLLDQLLPSLGEAFVASIRERVGRFSDGVRREEERLRAFFDYAHEHPEFFRILHEAEMFAPKAHRRHLLNLERGYVHALKVSWRRGELTGFDEHELEAVAHILMSARDYLAMRYAFWNGRPKRIPEHVIETYMKLMRHGLFGGKAARAHAEPNRRPKRPKVPSGLAVKRSASRLIRAPGERKAP